MKRALLAAGIHREITLPHEQEWELHHNSFSLCSKKVRVCMAELGLPYRSQHVHLIETGSYENVTRRHLALNPAGTVPVLVHQGHPIYESHEQIVHAARHAGARGEALLPDDPETRSLTRHWIDHASLVGPDPLHGSERRAGHCVPALTFPLFATMVRSIPYREIARGLLTHLDALGAQIESRGGPWIAGERFTLADVSWVVILDRLCEADWESWFWGNGQRPTVAAYWQALKTRPSYGEAIADMRCAATQRGIAELRAAKAADARLHEALEGT